MKYRVKIKVSYAETAFDFDDSLDASNFIAVAAEHHVKDGDKTVISMEVITEEEEA